MSLIVHIQDHAFQAILISSIETYPSSYIPQEVGKPKRLKNKSHEGEAMGLLFGQRLIKGEHLVFNVGLAVTMQATDRAADCVNYSRFHYERIREITESFPNLEFLGGFHSHPWLKEEYNQFSTEPSEDDEATAVAAACEYGDELLEVILGITALSRNSNRDAKALEHSIDSYCGRYKYRLSAYCTVGTAIDDDYKGIDTANSLGNSETALWPIDQLICPLAAHGGAIFT